VRAGELCAGYGGLALAVEEVFGASTAWFCEFEDAPSKILAHHWRGVTNFGDMTQVNWSKAEQVHVMSGGTPCQDLSHAGRRKGMTEGARSNLWVHMREAIAIQRPLYVVWENVRGAYSAEADSDLEFCPGCMGDSADRGTVLRALGRVLGDLSDLGYDTQWRGLRASDVGACHARFRVFVLAADRNNPGRGKQRRTITVRPEHPTIEHSSSDAADTESIGRGEGRTESAGIQRGLHAAICRNSSSPNAGHDGRERGEELDGEPEARGEVQLGDDADGRSGTNWGEYQPAIRRWERAIGRPAPRPTEPTGRDGGERLSPRFTEWMMGLPDGWVTDPAIGISRNEQLKACGNGVVPQQAIAALQDMLTAFQNEGIAA
jgi:DNA (cytosine-5)-methyltransferase 1